MNELPTTQQYYVETGLYTGFPFSIGQLEILHDLIYTEKTIDMYCQECKSKSIFTPIENRDKHQFEHVVKPFSVWEEKVRFPFTIQKNFRCSRNAAHKTYFLSFVEENSITKVGQYPSLADIATNDIEKYKKVLGKDYIELSKAVGLFAHGIGVGSFVYLRRIVENFIIKPAYESAKKKTDWDDELYNKSRFKERVSLLKSELPHFLIENRGLYSIISKGIHELSEDDCKRYFPVLRDCIEFILTELETKRQTDLKKAQLGKSLSSISDELQP